MTQQSHTHDLFVGFDLKSCPIVHTPFFTLHPLQTILSRHLDQAPGKSESNKPEWFSTLVRYHEFRLYLFDIGNPGRQLVEGELTLEVLFTKPREKSRRTENRPRVAIKFSQPFTGAYEFCWPFKEFASGPETQKSLKWKIEQEAKPVPSGGYPGCRGYRTKPYLDADGDAYDTVFKKRGNFEMSIALLHVAEPRKTFVYDPELRVGGG